VARSPGPKRELLLGVAVGLAGLLRSSNLLLIPALVLARWLAGWPRLAHFDWRWLRSPALALLVVAPWLAYSQLNAPEPPADQTRLLSYSTAMLHVDPGDPTSRRWSGSEIAARVPLRLKQNLAVLGSRLGTHVKGARDDPFEEAANERRESLVEASGIHIAIGALLLVLLVREVVTRRAAAELFALLTLLFLLVYFGFQSRLALPVYLIALPAAVAAARDMAFRFLGPRRGMALVAAALVALTAHDFAPRAGWDATRQEHLRLARASASVAPQLAADSRVAAWRGFHHQVFLERPVYSLHRAVGRLGAKAGIESVVERYDLDTVFLTTPGLADVKSTLSELYGEPMRAGSGLVWHVGRERGP
jgi:4-amino-4-deoxy-L-arabinose transferase-like glycosyltransferase